jgi:DNA-binding NarL/FixJ family response regulator
LAVLQAQALHGFFNADLDAVASAAEQGARLAREAGDLYVLQIMWLNLGSATLIAGDLDSAKPILIDALRASHQIDDRVAQFYLLDALGCHAALSGDAARAARLFGAADTVRAGVGANVMPFLAPSLAHARERAIQALGAAKFDEAFDAGRLLDRNDGVRLGLGASGDGADAASDVGGTGVLGKREAEVARLVADGLSNKQIAKRLFISERTVDSHVRNILNKLGFGSRAQIAAWIGMSDR